ncbi:DNA translocase FtsK [Coriobacteriia bacterium Es71-Z0120]|uniref:FtsK/SpoIIIE family DNA translocase n=1 Tax=Parvivirga hydrogeniphila TaxID=2939460 RepID=UPI002260D690|nr:DNA translocase FtsK [Parvivirga hydrogeniphila]MCL4079613.1 DNA translocase FtsK [Parvivirga hydrogeniphila]
MPPARALDEDTRNEIAGVVLSAAALALAISVVSPQTGLVPRYVARALTLGIGIGAYVLPIAVLLWGASFFVRSVRVNEVRVGGGLGLLLLSVISIASVGAPSAVFWEPDVLVARGGYVGGALAWAVRTLFGGAIAYVLLVALAFVGLVIAGMSVSELLERLARVLRRTPAEPAALEPHAKRRRAPEQPTLPLSDASPTPDVEPPAARQRRRTDPEARRVTVPTTAVVAPRPAEGFELPPMSLLKRNASAPGAHRANERELKATAQAIEQTLATFDVPSRVVDWIPGPTVTMFEVEIARGVKVGQVARLADDLALALAAPTIRILAPIPGKSYVGIEVPNERRLTVTLADVLETGAAAHPSPLLLGIGKDVAGEPVLVDLAPMPHLLIAGATGTGKSVCINAILMSLLMRATPAEVRLILIDPKRIELSLYNGVPHLYVPVVTEPKEAASALAWAVGEMEARLKQLQKANARNIAQYNAAVHDGRAPDGAQPMPYIVIVIDELADLMLVAAKEVEDSICRLSALARAAGIHLVVATQRPSTDIITGLIKTNITNRIAFAVSSGIDSRVILDQPGAEKLVGQGDMLFSMPVWPKPKRIQGAFVTEDEIVAVVEHLKAQAEPDYHEEILHLKVTQGGAADADADEDPLLWEAADLVVTTGMGSTSLLQRRLKVGYARAGRIMDMLEARGVVGPPDGSKPREVLVDVEELEAMKAFDREDRASDE